MTANKNYTTELHRQLNHQKELLQIMHDCFKDQLQWAKTLMMLIEMKEEQQPQQKSNLRLVK